MIFQYLLIKAIIRNFLVPYKKKVLFKEKNIFTLKLDGNKRDRKKKLRMREINEFEQRGKEIDIVLR